MVEEVIVVDSDVVELESILAVLVPSSLVLEPAVIEAVELIEVLSMLVESKVELRVPFGGSYPTGHNPKEKLSRRTSIADQLDAEDVQLTVNSSSV